MFEHKFTGIVGFLSVVVTVALILGHGILDKSIL